MFGNLHSVLCLPNQVKDAHRGGIRNAFAYCEEQIRNNRSPEIYWAYAFLYSQDRQSIKAFRICEEGLVHFPSDEKLLLCASRVSADLGHYDLADEYLSRINDPLFQGDFVQRTNLYKARHSMRLLVLARKLCQFQWVLNKVWSSTYAFKENLPVGLDMYHRLINKLGGTETFKNLGDSDYPMKCDYLAYQITSLRNEFEQFENVVQFLRNGKCTIAEIKKTDVEATVHCRSNWGQVFILQCWWSKPSRSQLLHISDCLPFPSEDTACAVILVVPEFNQADQLVIAAPKDRRAVIRLLAYEELALHKDPEKLIIEQCEHARTHPFFAMPEERIEEFKQFENCFCLNGKIWSITFWWQDRSN